MIFIAVDIIDISNIPHKNSSIKCIQHWSNGWLLLFCVKFT